VNQLAGLVLPISYGAIRLDLQDEEIISNSANADFLGDSPVGTRSDGSIGPSWVSGFERFG